MGMYTELHFNVELRTDTPPAVINILRFMVDGSPVHPKTPDHPLFESERWEWMLQSDSYYFNADTASTLRWDDIAQSHFLCLRFNVKNYDGEIEHFLDWIMPYVDAFDGDFLGFSRYEESQEPTLIHYRET